MTATAATAADFPALLDAHRGIVLKVAAAFRHTPDDRADLAQDIALRLWQAWPGYDAARPFSTWMYRIALNVAISQQRRERPRTHAALDELQDEPAGDTDVDFAARQQLALVQRAMATLVPLDRALLLLHLEGCSHRETAEVLGTSEGNVATRLNRIKDHLRRSVGAERGDA